jgi:hypothetical protein
MFCATQCLLLLDGGVSNNVCGKSTSLLSRVCWSSKSRFGLLLKLTCVWQSGRVLNLWFHGNITKLATIIIIHMAQRTQLVSRILVTGLQNNYIVTLLGGYVMSKGLLSYGRDIEVEGGIFCLPLSTLIRECKSIRSYIYYV